MILDTINYKYKAEPIRYHGSINQSVVKSTTTFS